MLVFDPADRVIKSDPTRATFLELRADSVGTSPGPLTLTVSNISLIFFLVFSLRNQKIFNRMMCTLCPLGHLPQTELLLPKLFLLICQLFKFKKAYEQSSFSQTIRYSSEAMDKFHLKKY
ncbi:hypothetical protein BpHYR1_050771 [Brachionus plicatilis]|uniref:Uncharacterized protein n=1 Tax=Brachionus plicatilis TaxID=10195 RepID=A0A3M7P9I9_BRAPC|nr:hypothetical protein BpHYR1_050771 [Brachionus plicatilis]